MIKKEEIEDLTKEEAKKDLNNIEKDLHILFEQEDKTMQNARKLSYSESWKSHWKKKIGNQYLFFYNIGKEGCKELDKENQKLKKLCKDLKDWKESKEKELSELRRLNKKYKPYFDRLRKGA